MGRVAGYWVDDRIRSQRVAPRTPSSLSAVRDLSIELIGTPAEIRRRGGIMPSWVILGMIILAALGLCTTVTVRTHGQSRAASEQYAKTVQDVDALRRGNATLRTEIRDLRGDARAIELAARSKLNMARANEIIVPVE